MGIRIKQSQFFPIHHATEPQYPFQTVHFFIHSDSSSQIRCSIFRQTGHTNYIFRFLPSKDNLILSMRAQKKFIITLIPFARSCSSGYIRIREIMEQAIISVKVKGRSDILLNRKKALFRFLRFPKSVSRNSHFIPSFKLHNVVETTIYLRRMRIILH